MQNVLLETEQSIKSLINKGTAETLLAAKNTLSLYKIAHDELKTDELLTLPEVSLSDAVCVQAGAAQKQLCLLNARFNYLTERSERLLYGYIDEVGELNTASDEFYHLSQFVSETLTSLKTDKPEFTLRIKETHENLARLEQVLVEAIQTLINRFELLLVHQSELYHRYSALNTQNSDRLKCAQPWSVKLFLCSLGNRFQSVLF
ncbi:hypothetical protein [Shewanella sp. YLB-07]|uniref:hypothetical protein n=1 Tax=Shewanella sp. YLB-07 TaxID=2601268 RepID=UPI00128C7582|nr:hypothetical protein [Shewanella sp. YLB-07]MPY21364.1 hypothetical protein [Shewanella sp. YLB-07]MPY22151.1 hypothetical protein [Shewanella sp. YLB-07]